LLEKLAVVRHRSCFTEYSNLRPWPGRVFGRAKPGLAPETAAYIPAG
jgi:hypothetical protein